jgi:hypothetical protein
VRDVPPRLLVAIGLTVVGLAVLAVASLTGGGGEEPATASTSTSSEVTVTAGTVPPTTIELLPDWYRKGNSRFSERGPAPTVSSLPSTTTTTTTTRRSGSGGD